MERIFGGTPFSRASSVVPELQMPTPERRRPDVFNISSDIEDVSSGEMMTAREEEPKQAILRTISYRTNIGTMSEEALKFQLFLRGVDVNDPEVSLEGLRKKGKGRGKTVKQHYLDIANGMVSDGRWETRVEEELLKSRTIEYRRKKQSRGSRDWYFINNKNLLIINKMILVKNKLKKKKVIDDDDNEYLDYLKYSHLHPTYNNTKIETSDKTTQFPDIRNNFTQTINKEDKGVDTGNDLNTIVGDYILHLGSKNFDRNAKMVQATAEMLKGSKSKSPPSSSSSNDSEGFLSRNARRGFRLAEFALNTAITGANLTMALSDALVDLTSAPHQSSEEEPVNNPEVISVQSSPPQTINSSSSDVEEIPPLIQISSSSSSRQTPSSIPAPTSPQSSRASSAKTTPRRKTSKWLHFHYIMSHQWSWVVS